MTDAAAGTGRYLVLLANDSAVDGARAMTRVAGLHTASTADLGGAGAANMLGQADGLLLHELGVAVVTADPDQARALTRESGQPGPISLVEAERTVYAIAAPAREPETVDETTFTWGLQVVGVPDTPATGAGIRVAVLDTGMDTAHPDFAGRNVVTSSFVPGEDVADGHGHGTHCIGTSCGPRTPGDGPGYGVASAADIYAGKVLGNGGSGSDGGILAGISWAISNGCSVVSMSLGAAAEAGAPHSPIYEEVAQRAMARGTLIVAAAGNESRRSAGFVAPVGHPANCPSIMAVGALDSAGAIADFSCGTLDPNGEVDIAGPGVNVHSAWPMPQRYRTISGTSMATPHVAGVAALLAEHTGARAWELWARLTQSAKRLPLPSTDVGAGLVFAPR